MVVFVHAEEILDPTSCPSVTFHLIDCIFPDYDRVPTSMEENTTQNVHRLNRYRLMLVGLVHKTLK